MLIYPHINPIALQIGKLKIHWYGVMYMLSFLLFVLVGKWRLKRCGHPYITSRLIDDFLFYGALGVVIGGRLGYCLFYQPEFYLTHPWDILKTWDGGMSFHGGMLGVFVSTYIISRLHQRSFFEFSDFIALFIPLALFCGRVGNFINGELWGRITTSTLPWMMIYPQSGVMLARHPSEIYEALGEGVLLFIILWVYARKPRYVGQISGIFMLGYGIIRFCLEYFREPDPFLLNFAHRTHLSMGQWLCVPMIIAGIIIYVYASRKKSMLIKI